MSCLVRSSPTTLGHAPVQSPFGAARGAGLGQVPAEQSLDASVRSQRSGRSTPRSGPGGAVARRLRVMSCLGHAPVSVTVRRRSRGGPRSGPGGAVARRLGQVPAERSLDASVRSWRSGRSTPTCLVLSGPCTRLCHRSAPLAWGASVRYPTVPQFGSVRFGSVRCDSDRSSPVLSSIY